MRHKRITLAAAMAFACASLLHAEPVSVRKFGARGAGAADDTKAIQAAIEAAQKLTRAGQYPQAIYYGTQPEVLIPAGIYRISAPLVIGAYTRLRGEGNAVLKATSADVDIVHCLHAYRIQISGLCFLGGRRAIYFRTNNVDTSNVLVDNCQFIQSNAAAIYAEDGSNSTFVKITNSIFYGCEQAFRNTCDKAVVMDCWISTRKEMKNKAVFENRGVLHLERVLGVPAVVAENDQRWIDNYNVVSCTRVRFGGEGAGFCAVNNYAKYDHTYPVWPTQVTLDNCDIYCIGNPRRRAAIYCNEIPNQITVRNCSGLIDVPIVKIEEKIDLKQYLAKAARNPSLCRFEIRDNSVNEMWEALPEPMRPFQSRSPGPVNVRESGARGTGAVDDTRAIQAAFDRAAKARTGVRFPAGRYKISDTIRIGVTEVRGEGYPEIVQANPGKDIFFAPGIWRTTISGLQFRGGRDQISLGNPNIDQGFLVISDCRFRDAAGVAIRFRERTSSTFALIEKCAFRNCMQALVAVTDQTHLRDCWITSSINMRQKAVIENRGVLTCVNILGVPLVNGNDQRWIDNYGTLTCRKFRFGGEGGGFTPVVNFAKVRQSLYGPRIVLDDCFVGALGNSKRACAIYCEEIPNQIVVTHSSLAGVPAVIVDPKIDLKQYFAGVRPGMLSFDVSDNVGEFAGKLPQEMLAAAARRTTAIEYGDRQLSAEETRKALARAIEAARKLPAAAPGVMAYKTKNGHKQQAAPGKFIAISPRTHKWDLDDHMDGTAEKNAAYLAVAPAGDDVVILRRIAAEDNWPHVRIRGVKADLAKHPFLSWQLKDNGLDPAGYAVKVEHAASKRTILLTEMHWRPFFDYRAYDLRQVFGLRTGVHTFDIKFYFLGINFHSATRVAKAKKGDFLALDFLRLEAE